MEYKLLTEFITLQAILKELGIIQSGGAAKNFLKETKVLLNNNIENRRGKKLRIGDEIAIPARGIVVTLIAPTNQEIKNYQEELAEKKRVANLVKEINQANKKTAKSKQSGLKNSNHSKKYKPVRFPGI